MISSIKNPWVRKPLVVLLAVPMLILVLIVGLAATIEDTARYAWTFKYAWRGETYRGRRARG